MWWVSKHHEEIYLITADNLKLNGFHRGYASLTDWLQMWAGVLALSAGMTALGREATLSDGSPRWLHEGNPETRIGQLKSRL
jgi:hypothetical protein